PLMAVGYGPRCVPVMQLVAAAAGICDLLWMVDGSQAEMSETMELLRRFGPVVDRQGLDGPELLAQIAAYEPDGLVTYLDAGMIDYAVLAEALGLPFHS